jgi:hypothetical protein
LGKPIFSDDRVKAPCFRAHSTTRSRNTAPTINWRCCTDVWPEREVASFPEIQRQLNTQLHKELGLADAVASSVSNQGATTMTMNTETHSLVESSLKYWTIKSRSRRLDTWQLLHPVCQPVELSGLVHPREAIRPEIGDGLALPMASRSELQGRQHFAIYAKIA